MRTMKLARHVSQKTKVLKQKPRGEIDSIGLKQSRRSHSISLIVILGITLNLASSIVLYITFLLAYTNNHTAIITINSYNEANVELFLISIVIIIGIVGLGLSIKNMEKKRDNKI
jgi:hypothetical protein